MRIDRGKVFKKNSRILERDVDGAPVLIDPYRRTLVRLNSTGREIWRLVDGARPVAEVLETLEIEFDVDAKKLKRDVLGLLQELAKREMIR